MAAILFSQHHRRRAVGVGHAQADTRIGAEEVEDAVIAPLRQRASRQRVGAALGLGQGRRRAKSIEDIAATAARASIRMHCPCKRQLS